MIQSLSLTGSSFLILFIATNLAFRCYLSTANLNCKHKLLELKLFARVSEDVKKKNIRWPFYRVKTPPRIHYSLKKKKPKPRGQCARHTSMLRSVRGPWAPYTWGPASRSSQAPASRLVPAPPALGTHLTPTTQGSAPQGRDSGPAATPERRPAKEQ